MAQATAPILDSTWAAAPGCPHLLKFWEGNRTTVGHQSSGSEVVKTPRSNRGIVRSSTWVWPCWRVTCQSKFDVENSCSR